MDGDFHVQLDDIALCSTWQERKARIIVLGHSDRLGVESIPPRAPTTSIQSLLLVLQERTCIERIAMAGTLSDSSAT
jgi:hypothetical protein